MKTKEFRLNKCNHCSSKERKVRLSKNGNFYTVQCTACQRKIASTRGSVLLDLWNSLNGGN